MLATLLLLAAFQDVPARPVPSEDRVQGIVHSPEGLPEEEIVQVRLEATLDEVDL